MTNRVMVNVIFAEKLIPSSSQKVGPPEYFKPMHIDSIAGARVQKFVICQPNVLFCCQREVKSSRALSVTDNDLTVHEFIYAETVARFAKMITEVCVSDTVAFPNNVPHLPVALIVPA